MMRIYENPSKTSENRLPQRAYYIPSGKSEYRLLNGWSRDRKKGSSRFDRIPVELVDELYIGGPADYRLFVPEGLPENYTSKDFAKATHIPVGYAQTLLGILYFLQVVERTGKSGRSYTYRNTFKTPE